MRNKVLFEKWQEEAYYDWLEEARERTISAIKSLVGDLKERTYIHRWAFKRIPELLVELKEIDAELYPEPKEGEGEE